MKPATAIAYGAELYQRISVVINSSLEFNLLAYRMMIHPPNNGLNRTRRQLTSDPLGTMRTG
ncbi:MAG: hypothetical protein WKF84_13550 [Pyrinomonadaceae bacterium]